MCLPVTSRALGALRATMEERTRRLIDGMKLEVRVWWRHSSEHNPAAIVVRKLTPTLLVVLLLLSAV